MATNGTGSGAADVFSLPNIDGRPNVAEDLPDIFVEEGEEHGSGEIPVLLNVKFGKPNDQEWARVHPDPTRARCVYCVKDKHSFGKLYIVARPLLKLVGHKARQYVLRQAITVRKTTYLWPVPMLTADCMPADKEQHEAAMKAMSKWIRLEWVDSGFDGKEPEEDLGEPCWPVEPFDEVVNLGVRGVIIADRDHPWMRNFLGRK